VPAIILLRSTAAGQSQGLPEVVALPAGIVATPAAAAIELAYGRWFCPFIQWNGFGDERQSQPRTLGSFSTNQGRSWRDMVAYADGAAEGLGSFRGTPILLGGGQLQVIYWAANKRSGANLSNHLCTGDASAPVGYARVNQSARPDGGTGGSGRLASQCGLHPARRGASRHCGCAIGLWRAELGCYWARPAWCCVF